MALEGLSVQLLLLLLCLGGASAFDSGDGYKLTVIIASLGGGLLVALIICFIIYFMVKKGFFASKGDNYDNYENGGVIRYNPSGQSSVVYRSVCGGTVS